MDYIARVNPKYLAAIALFRAKNDVRYYLNGIRIEPHPEKGVVIVATDGHCLGAIHDPSGFATEAFIFQPSERVVKACLLKRWNRIYQPEAAWIAERCTVVVANSSELGDQKPELFGDFTIETASSQLIDGKFPDWRRVINRVKPDETKPGHPWMRSPVMQPYLKAAEILSPVFPTLHCQPHGPDGSVYVRVHLPAPETGRFFGVAMPCWDDSHPGEELPAWLKAMNATTEPATQQ